MTRKLRSLVFMSLPLLLLLGLGPQQVFAHLPSHASAVRPLSAEHVGPAGVVTSPSAKAGGRHPAVQARPTASKRARKRWEAIGLFFTRALNRQEKAFRGSHGKYESTMQLYHSGAMNGPMQALTRKFGIGAIRNWSWKFYVDTSPDGKKYQASVHGASTQGRVKCLPVFFSDQSGAIYEGTAIGCR